MPQEKFMPGKTRFFFFGIFFTLAVLILAGATYNRGALITAGRYQISTWDLPMENGRGIYGVFIVDTSTGRTKSIYKAVYNGQVESVKENFLDKPFYHDEHNEAAAPDQNAMNIPGKLNMPRQR